MKKITCGILIYVESNLLLCHSTGNKHWDIPKGIKEDKETEIEAAIRECKEETNIDIEENKLLHLGLFKYNKSKDISLFKIKLNSLDLKKLKCISMVEPKEGLPFPEVDRFELFSIEEALKKMSKVLKTTLTRENLV